MIDIDSNLCIPIVTAIISGLIAVVAVTFKNIRPYIHVTVNCWFCNENSRIPLSKKNSFVCSSCEQYNGFTKGGDYNRDIPAQRMENLNYLYNTRKNKCPKLYSPLNNGLCHTCNFNQSLKVKSLAEFQPFLEDNFDIEVEEYRQRLDRMFSLCRDCEGILHQTLGKQNSWIKPLFLSYRLMESKKQIMKAVTSINQGSIFGFAIKCFLVSTANFLLMCTLYKSSLPDDYLLVEFEPKLRNLYLFGNENSSVICLLSLFTLILWLRSHGRKLICAVDVFCLVLWSLFLGLSSSNFSLEIYFTWSLQVLALFTFLTTLLTVCKKRISFTLKNKSPTRIRLNEHDLSQYSNGSVDNMSPVRTPISEESYKIYNKQEDSPGSELLIDSKTSKVQNDNSELGSTFGGLNIGTPKKNNEKSFSAKSLFSEKNHNILAQPKLFSKVTQASWVAGGYWGPTGSPQKGRSNQSVYKELQEQRIPPFSLSRSSSHSSGFISHTSGTCNSLFDSGRASVCTETDRTSQLSESASMYPRSVSNQRFGSRSPTLSNATSYGLNQNDFQSCKSSIYNESACKYGDCSMSVNSSTPGLNGSLVNETKIHERLYGRYCNPLVAFILGISITANFFLFLNNLNR